MSKSEILDRVFNNRLMKVFIPIVNPVITWINNGSCVSTRFDRLNNYWIHSERGETLLIDVHPYWNISNTTIEKAVKSISCEHYLPGKGDTIIDLGAGVGFETFYFQKLVGESGCVHAIEAHPNTSFLLNLLCLNNNYKNVNYKNVIFP